MSLIEITHFVNPHLFWFKYKKQDLSFQEKIKSFETRLANNIPVKHPERIKTDDVIALNWISKNKWIRVNVLARENPKLIVWAIDYGIPIITTFDLIAKLDSDLERECRATESPVSMGGVYGILPARMGLGVSFFYCTIEFTLLDRKGSISHYTQIYLYTLKYVQILKA